MTTTELPLFPASVVGSLPRPRHVRELIELILRARLQWERHVKKHLR